VAAFEATAQLASHHYSLDPAQLAQSARTRARELWRAAPSRSPNSAIIRDRRIVRRRASDSSRR
jgi:hypothetical protein